MSPGLAILVGALLGGALGSFWACAAYRLPRGISLTAQRSFCPSCQSAVPGIRNIPVLSWLLLRGRSACCQQPLSPRYLVIEGLGVVIGAGSAVLLGIYGPAALTIGTLVLGLALKRRLVNRGGIEQQEIVDPEDH